MEGSSLKPPSISIGQRRISVSVHLSYQSLGHFVDFFFFFFFSQAAPSSALQRGQLIYNEEKKRAGPEWL